MGLYDDRLADLSEPRQSRRVAHRRPAPARGPMLRPRPSSLERPYPTPAVAAARKPSMSVQSLLFDRGSWTTSSAKRWAQDHGYKYGKVDVTDQYIRIRQLDPKGSKVKRTIPFGKGIRAVVAREGTNSMATVQASRRRRKKTAAKGARKRPRRRRARAAAPAARKRPRRRARKAAAEVRRPRRRRRVRVEARRVRRRGHDRRRRRRVFG